MHRFDRDTVATPLGDGRFEAAIDRGWWIVEGPNGGYLAAILVRAMGDAVADRERSPRSLTIHYTARPVEGAAMIVTRIERTGRSLTTVSAHMEQAGKRIAIAIGAFSKPRKTPQFAHAQMPEVFPLERSEPMRRPPEISIPFHDQFDIRFASEERPWVGAGRGRSVAWIRTAEPRILDAPLAATLTDALPPAVFSVGLERASVRGVPTVDLTIHFRATLPWEGLTAEDHLLADFRTREAREGFLEEDGEIWAPDGTLLVQSRQLALFV